MQIISKNVLYHKEGHEQRINQDFHTCVVRSFCCYIDDICRYNGKNPDRRMLDGKKYNGKKQLSVISLINAEKYFQAVALKVSKSAFSEASRSMSSGLVKSIMSVHFLIIVMYDFQSRLSVNFIAGIGCSS